MSSSSPDLSSSPELAIALTSVLRATVATSHIFRSIPASLTKSDKSPVTLGDFAAQAIVNTLLRAYFPDDGIVAEEEAAPLRGDGEEATKMRAKVGELVQMALAKSETELSGAKEDDLPGGKKWDEKDWTQDERFLDAIDRGNHPGGSKGRVWALDPIDGTKGFLRGGQYAICLSLLQDGKPILSAMSCPNLPFSLAHPKPAEGDRSGVPGWGTVFLAAKGQGSWARAVEHNSSSVTEGSTWERIHMRELTDFTKATFCESVEAGHSSHSTNADIASTLKITSPSVRMDSQAKYASVSRGDGDIYLRLPVGDGSYQEKIWDHASGALLAEEAGGKVSDCAGRDLDFSKGRTLSANKGVVVAAKNLHGEVVEAVKKALEKEGRGHLLK